MAFRVSIYADDVAMFIKPDPQELEAVQQILNTFGQASGLLTNLRKSSCIPISCDGLDLVEILGGFECPLSAFLQVSGYAAFLTPGLSALIFSRSWTHSSRKLLAGKCPPPREVV
jgi:hypothetical protein